MVTESNIDLIKIPVNTLDSRSLKVLTEEIPEMEFMFEKFTAGHVRDYFRNPRKKEILFKGLKEINITKIRHSSETLSLSEMMFEVPTLVVHPCKVDFKISSYSEELGRLVSSLFSNISGYRRTMESNKVYPRFETSGKRLMINKVVVGDYYPDRNLIMIYFNIFPEYPSRKIIMSSTYFLKKLFEINEIKLDSLSQEVSEKFKEAVEEQTIKKFVLSVDKVITRKTTELSSNNTNIEKYSTELIASYGNIRRLTSEVFQLKKFRQEFKNKFRRNISTIKQLPFVEELKITAQGIIVDVGDISISYGKSYCYIGDLSIIINPTKVTIKNKYPFRHRGSSSATIYEHPHVMDGDLCLGSYSSKVTKHLSNLELKQLVFVIYRFLKTYSKGHAYVELVTWKAFRKRENKFDDLGHAIKTKTTKAKTITRRKLKNE